MYHKLIFCFSTGKFKDIYNDYQYTYQSCGVVLIIASVFLFVGMGINYRLLNKEKKEEEERKAKLEGEEEESNKDNATKEATNDRVGAVDKTKTTEDIV